MSALRPDDEDKPFIARWNLLARILLVETSVKMVARAAMDYADFDDGTSCFPSNERLARETGYNEKTVRTAWAAMRALGMAVRVGHGVAHQRLADHYELNIPDNWIGLPILGPHGRKFKCLNCGKLFNPLGNCEVASKAGKDELSWKLGFMSFCPTPKVEIHEPGREPYKVPKCQQLWKDAEVSQGRPKWNARGAERWKWFRIARGDDW